MSTNIIATNVNILHQIRFFKTSSKYVLACIPKCGSSYYAWSIFLKTHPYAQRLLDSRGENLRLLNDRDALSLSRYVLKEDIKDENVILPFRDPISRFISIFAYLQDISEQEILGNKIDHEIRKIVAESNSNKDIFFDYFINVWEKISIAVPQSLYYTNSTTLLPYNNTERICKLINSVHISKVINKGVIDKKEIILTKSQIEKIREIYKEDYKLKNVCCK